jgi:hypothetical protein
VRYRGGMAIGDDDALACPALRADLGGMITSFFSSRLLTPDIAAAVAVESAWHCWAYVYTTPRGAEHHLTSQSSACIHTAIAIR